MSDIVFLTGPARSGKSRRAVELAARWGEGTVFLATCRATADDAEMAARIRRHRAERPAAWRTLEAPADVPAALAALAPRPAGVLLDCLTLWLADRLDRVDDAIIGEWKALLAHLAAAPYPGIIVGNEVGWSLVPGNPLLRRFRDLAGTLAQLTAEVSTESWLMVAGCALRLK
ncbi:MAG: bifunctional adenosylcobinamide kinase/adenosylcobinamide-phosphate guanylyltransferase [Candidatus Accumulibacter sp.]|jgi:adenosylcobinamide kinase/adenosylcobinamide-phosphate guanylyltransferase|nr:bifunctional adenosylcobinamide kinase/adenosylcobinamide-phosphate guanylyltransferase [Accumulibacter sp.]